MKPNYFVSLITEDNDYQRAQWKAAERAAQSLGVHVTLMHASNDAVTQTQQLLKVIQSGQNRPDAIICEPVGTGMPQVARAAAKEGIGWVILNREVDYLEALHKEFKVPAFSINADNEEIGRIQGRQLAAFLPKGGHVLYMEGPSTSTVSRQRTSGMMDTKPGNIEMRVLKGQWTEASAYQSITSWLRLSTSANLGISLVACQNDAMARGARKAFMEEQGKWFKLVFSGCDGVPEAGQVWVRDGSLAATVVVPTTTNVALEGLVKRMQTGIEPPFNTYTKPASYPPIEQISAIATVPVATAPEYVTPRF